MTAIARWILSAVAVLLAIVLVFLFVTVERRENLASEADGLSWREVLTWDFADGEHPDGWGWGKWVVENGYVELEDSSGEISVYFLPVEHEPDFVMVTEMMLVADRSGGPASAHLLTRDYHGMSHESGCTVRAEQDSMSVRHKIDHHEYLLEIVPVSVRLEYGQWYRVRFTVARGEISVHIDGHRVYVSGERFPQGLYGEPHVAAENGVVRFRNFQVLDAARASGPGLERTGGQH